MIGQTISHYKILEKLGEGGMGVVYKAQDLELDRIVALKFLSSLLTSDEAERKRFEQEAKAVSALDHPNICTFYELGKTDRGDLFIAMAYYEGETVREKVKVRPLPIPEALDIALGMAQGLSKAHEKGVTHRDIKSENIIIETVGGVKIMDFGLAKTVGVSTLTKTGATLGTVPYMSPEQARGEKVDHRSDIWSFGTVLYEMVTGQMPFKSQYNDAMVYMILNENPQPVTALRTGVPMELERIISKCLEKKPGDRYQHMDDAIVDLRKVSVDSVKSTSRPSRIWRPSSRKWIAVALTATVITSVIILYVSVPTSADGEIHSIAVLPFEEVSRDVTDPYFADGIAEELIVALSKVPGLRVAGRASSFRFRDKSADMRSIAHALNVATLLDGKVRRSEQRMRVGVELTSASDGSLVWSEIYEFEIRNAFELQDEITRAIAGALRIRLARSADSVGSARTTRHVDPEAYEAYLKGLALQRRRGRFVEQSIPYFERAIARDSSFARAWAQLAWALAGLPLFSRNEPPDLPERAFAAARRAITLDATSGEAHGALAGAYLFISGDITRAIKEAEQAVALDPNFSDGYQRLAIALGAAGDYDRAVAAARRAVDLDPMAAGARNILARSSLYARQFTAAVASARNALQLDSLIPHAPGQQAVAELLLGHRDTARAIALRLPNIPVIAVHRSFVLAATGDRASNAELLRTLEGQRSTRYSGETALAAAYLGMGDSTQALLALERAAKRRESFVAIEFGHPMLDPIRGSARFGAVLRAYGVDAAKVNSAATRHAE